MKRKRGTALLEVLIALAILASAGLSTVALVNQLIREQAAMTMREGEMATASRVLAAVTLLTREELNQRLGDREIGEYQVNIQRPERTLYRLAVAARSAPGHELLVTVVYKP